MVLWHSVFNLLTELLPSEHISFSVSLALVPCSHVLWTRAHLPSWQLRLLL